MTGCLLMEKSFFWDLSSWKSFESLVAVFFFRILATSTSLHCEYAASWVFLWATKLLSSSTPECHTSQIQSIFHQRQLELRVLTPEKLNTQITDCVALQIRRQFCSDARQNFISSFAFAALSQRMGFTVAVFFTQTSGWGRKGVRRVIWKQM